MSRTKELYEDHVDGIRTQIEAGSIDKEAAVAALGGDRGEAETAFDELAPKAKHTDGPWLIDPSEDLPLAIIAGDADDGICEIGDAGSCKADATPEQLANAALIAAAPDMLAELAVARDELERAADIVEHVGRKDQAERMRYRANAVRAMIAKAKAA